jgi:hypothetical protein
MTEFLSRLVERSLPSTRATPMPVVPPLFAAGALLGEYPTPEDVQPAIAQAPRRHEDVPPTELRTVDDGRQSDADVASDRFDRSAAPSAPLQGPARQPVLSSDATTALAPARHVGPESHESDDRGQVRGHSGIRVRAQTTGVAGTAREDGASIARAAPAVPAPRAEPVASQESAAPIVRVSIGRIEVRAVSPQPPVPVRPTVAQSQKRSAIVLDDYLRARGKPL